MSEINQEIQSTQETSPFEFHDGIEPVLQRADEGWGHPTHSMQNHHGLQTLWKNALLSASAIATVLSMSACDADVTVKQEDVLTALATVTPAATIHIDRPENPGIIIEPTEEPLIAPTMAAPEIPPPPEEIDTSLAPSCNPAEPLCAPFNTEIKPVSIITDDSMFPAIRTARSLYMGDATDHSEYPEAKIPPNLPIPITQEVLAIRAMPGTHNRLISAMRYLDMERNPRYDHTKTGLYTCSIYAYDLARVLGIPFPRYLDQNNDLLQENIDPQTVQGIWEAGPTDITRWFTNHSQRYGWTEIQDDQIYQYLKDGYYMVAVNSGHIRTLGALPIDRDSDTLFPFVTQATNNQFMSGDIRYHSSWPANEGTKFYAIPY